MNETRRGALQETERPYRDDRDPAEQGQSGDRDIPPQDPPARSIARDADDDDRGSER